MSTTGSAPTTSAATAGIGSPAPRVGVADQVRGDLTDALQSVGEHHVIVCGTLGRRSPAVPSPRCRPDDRTRRRSRRPAAGMRGGAIAGASGIAIQDGRGNRLRHNAVEPQRAYDGGVTEVDPCPPAAVAAGRSRGAFPARRHQHAGPGRHGSLGRAPAITVCRRVRHRRLSRPLRSARSGGEIVAGAPGIPTCGPRCAIDRALTDERGSAGVPAIRRAEARLSTGCRVSSIRTYIAPDSRTTTMDASPRHPLAQQRQHRADRDGDRRQDTADGQRKRLPAKRIVEHPGVTAHQRVLHPTHQKAVPADLQTRRRLPASLPPASVTAARRGQITCWSGVPGRRRRADGFRSCRCRRTFPTGFATGRPAPRGSRARRRS